MGDIVSIIDHKKRKEHLELQEAARQAEQEYLEFIKLLRYFVAIQTPRYNEIQISPGNGHEHMLFDDKGVDIRKESYTLTVEEVFENEVNYDDLLISALISLAPRKIVIRDSENFSPILLNTIKDTFDNVEMR